MTKVKDLFFEKPNTNVVEISDGGNYGKFVIKPLERGFGITLGNALRRILMSSLPGAAIVRIRIEGAEHEFMSIDGVIEDVMTIILNLKKVVFKQVHSALGGRLRTVLVSAAPVPKELVTNFEGFGFNVLQGYGLSETAPVVAGTPEKNRVAGTVGFASNCEIKLDNTDEKGIGEILVRGNNVMLGYYEDEEATREVLVDGWFHTGDLGRMDEKGNLIITGRCKSVIVTPKLRTGLCE